MSDLTIAHQRAIVDAAVLLKPVLDAWRIGDYDTAFEAIERADADELRLMLVAALGAWCKPVDNTPA